MTTHDVGSVGRTRSAITVEQADSLTDGEVADLAEILIKTVAAGYSIGYMTPPSAAAAAAYWQGVLAPNN